MQEIESEGSHQGMKRFVNGVEVELSEDATAEIEQRGDRLYVHSSNGTHTAAAVRSGDAVLVSYRGLQYRIEKAAPRTRSTHVGSGEIRAPMPGRIADVLVSTGEKVKSGQKLLVLEAMKTQQAISAPFDGLIAQLDAVKGSQVDEGQLLVSVEPKAG